MENLKNCINNDLANNYGNLCQRVFSFIKKNCDNKIPIANNLKEEDIKLLNNIKDNVPKLINLINNQNLNEYIKIVVKFSFEANKYFNDTEPWSFKNKQPERMNAILNTIVLQIRNISILLNPIIPLSTKKVLDTINLSDKDILISNINNQNNLNNEKELKSLDILFKKIENDN